MPDDEGFRAHDTLEKVWQRVEVEPMNAVVVNGEKAGKQETPGAQDGFP